jgi:Tol biopolymer transport system component
MQIYKMNRDGSSATPLTAGPYDVYPSCTPDGKWLFYADNHDHDHPQIKRILMDGGNAEPVAIGMRYSFSPDGKFLAGIHLGGTPNLQIFSTDPVKKIQSLALPADFFFFAAFSADDKTVFFTTKTGPDSTVWRQSLENATPVKVATLPGKTVRWIRSSPDGANLGLIVDTPQSQAVLLRDVQ